MSSEKERSRFWFSWAGTAQNRECWRGSENSWPRLSCRGRGKKSLGIGTGVTHRSYVMEDIAAPFVSQVVQCRPFLMQRGFCIKSVQVSNSVSAGRCLRVRKYIHVCPERAIKLSAACNSSCCPKALFGHLVC